jgi:hypothetical protein
VSDNIHAPAAFSPERHWNRFDKRLGEIQRLSGCCRKEENLLPLPVNEPWPLLYRLSYLKNYVIESIRKQTYGFINIFISFFNFVIYV